MDPTYVPYESHLSYPDHLLLQLSATVRSLTWTFCNVSSDGTLHLCATHLCGKIMYAPVHIGVVLPVVVVQGLQDSFRLLGCGSVVQIDERLPVHLLVEDGEVGADALSQCAWYRGLGGLACYVWRRLLS